MTDKSKTPPAKKTIQDPPEYAAANKLKGREAQATYQQNGQSAVAPASNDPKDERDGRVGTGNVSGDFLGGPQDVAEAPPSEWSGRGKPPEPVSQDLRGQLKWNEQRTGETGDWLGGPQNGEEENHLGDWLGGPQNGAEAPGSKESGPTGSGKAQGEGARNPQTGERIARNPQTGE